MDQTQLALLALLVGIVVGGSVVGLVVGALRARDRALAQVSTAVPEGVDAMLGAMDDPAFVCDTSSTVLALSPAAEVFGLSAGLAIASDDLPGGEPSSSAAETRARSSRQRRTGARFCSTR